MGLFTKRNGDGRGCHGSKHGAVVRQLWHGGGKIVVDDGGQGGIRMRLRLRMSM